jgi:hypothetical protein
MSIAFIIPVFHAHFHHIYNNIEVFKYNKVPLFLIFSNIGEMELYIKHAPPGEREYAKCIVLPPELVNDEKTIVTSKKFYAFKKLIDSDYDYFISIDAEILVNPAFLTNENILEKVLKVFENKKIFGGMMDPHDFNTRMTGSHVNFELFSKILRNAASVFKDAEFEIIKEKTNNFRLYTVWNDLVVYKKDHLMDFFSKIDERKITDRLYFDDVIYHYYLFLYHGFTFFNVTEIIPDMQTSFELFVEFTRDELDLIKEMGFSYSWTTLHEYKRHKDFFDAERLFLCYHVDREHHYDTYKRVTGK